MPSESESRADGRRNRVATETVDATDAATAKWMLAVTAGKPVDVAVRGAFIDGVRYGLDTLTRISGGSADA